MTTAKQSSRKIWQSLLSADNLCTLGNKRRNAPSGTRTAFHKDYDRLIFSQSFRQLNQKTQVHPLTQQMGIHTRLTHSLEVSCVGRSLGMLSAEKIADDLPKGVSGADIGVIVQAACLAHDIGNPPFGHAGEYAIRDWFYQPAQRDFLAQLTAEQQVDLLGYEGNAQGFRLLTRNEHHPDNGGMRLTSATLGAFMKYPYLSTPVNTPNKKAPISPRHIRKFGCFMSEADFLAQLGEQLQLPRVAHGFARHPLAYLLEAADDICYALIDLEDGILLGMLEYQEVEPLLLKLVGKRLGMPPEVKNNAPVAQKLAALRGRAMRRMVDKVTDAFAQNQTALLTGTLEGSLFDHCPPNVQESIHSAKQLANTRIFQHPSKVRLEIMANRCLHTLLDAFMPLALLGNTPDAQLHSFEPLRLLTLVNNHLANYNRQLGEDVYQNALCILDMITGMNDHEAYHLAQELKGNWSINF